MGLFTKNGSEEAIFSSNFKLVTGIPGWGENVLVIKAELLADRITFYSSPFGQAKTISLLYSQILETGIYSETEILEKSKSVIGRSVAGGLLFGPLGALIGGMSGVGTEKTKKNHYYYTISFTSSDNSSRMISLGTECMGCNYHKFNEILRSHLPKPTANEFNKEFL